MSPLREFNLIKDVIKIARSAKENKLGIYSDRKVEVLAIKLKNKRMESCAWEMVGPSDRENRDKRITNKTNMSQVTRFMDESMDIYKLKTTRLDE